METILAVRIAHPNAAPPRREIPHSYLAACVDPLFRSISLQGRQHPQQQQSRQAMPIVSGNGSGGGCSSGSEQEKAAPVYV